MNTTKSKSKQLFRPYLNRAELSYILSHTTREMHLETANSLHKKLKMFLIKIDEELIAPSHIIKTESIEEKLGFNSLLDDSTKAGISTLKQQLYNQYLQNPDYEFSKSEQLLIGEYKYETGLMSPEEETKFEEEFLDSISVENTNDN